MHRTTLIAAVTLVGLQCSVVPAIATTSIAVQQETVVILHKHSVRSMPTSDSNLVTYVNPTRPITAAQTILPVIARASDVHGHKWLRVRLPGRTLVGATPPRTGWIRTTETRPASTPWHIVVDLSDRRVFVFEGGRRIRTYPAIVGAASTPTPTGEYFVEETVKLDRSAVGAPFALATSARSNVLREFDGGPGQIALHGLNNVGGRLGTAASHGCVRLANRAVSWLAVRIGPGVPVTIRT